jgi:hypothetical protein
MSVHPTALERAFELARSGEYLSVEAIRKQLNLEGLNAAQVEGCTLYRQLKEAIRNGRAPEPEPEQAKQAS